MGPHIPEPLYFLSINREQKHAQIFRRKGPRRSFAHRAGDIVVENFAPAS
jgi:hypothetical protein